MKKTLLVALTTLPLFANAGLMDSLTDSVTSSVKDAANTAVSGAVDNASSGAIKKALDIKEDGANKQVVKEKLGAPASTKTEAGLEVWTYDLEALKKASPMLAETTKTLLKDTDAAKKNVVIKFEGETVKKVDLTDKAQG
ncbi:hypothetical protein LA366_18090 [Aeromonas jandaei]|uniref:Uncharacterized protein n=1 Tax=Aeromonas jandaei TaxID=650 RepID=A0A7T4A6L6_AERJA|nr:hypothetical protein [Aeromonas jandaei]QQB18295.1 hypothetical protein I6H43_11865 [Aeromonas jandaei]UCA32964.1 hypothetical protein LA366_18090 [Aeromonas jandaei]